MKGTLRGNHARSDDAMYGEPRGIARRKSKVEFNEDEDDHEDDSTTSDDDTSDDDDDDETPDEADTLFTSTRNKTSTSLSNRVTGAVASINGNGSNNKTSEPPPSIKHLVSSTGLFPVRSDGWRRASVNILLSLCPFFLFLRNLEISKTTIF